MLQIALAYGKEDRLGRKSMIVLICPYLLVNSNPEKLFKSSWKGKVTTTEVQKRMDDKEKTDEYLHGQERTTFLEFDYQRVDQKHNMNAHQEQH